MRLLRVIRYIFRGKDFLQNFPSSVLRCEIHVVKCESVLVKDACQRGQIAPASAGMPAVRALLNERPRLQASSEAAKSKQGGL
jgi:hypothetical protein